MVDGSWKGDWGIGVLADWRLRCYNGPMSAEPEASSPAIGSLNEKPLHAALKEWYAQTGDRLEAPIDGFVVDIVRGDVLIEIQTRNFFGIKRKLLELTKSHPVQLVYPVAREKWIVKVSDNGNSVLSRRKSPKRGIYADVFAELVSFPQLMAHSNFSLEVLLIQEEEVRRYDRRRGWRRRGWVTDERRLLEVVDRQLFRTPSDMGALVPLDVAEPYTTSDLAAAIGRPRRLAQRMAYCLREMGTIVAQGKRGRALLYARSRTET